MWSFEGNFRTKPTQSLRGASKQEQKDSLLKRLQEERQGREQVRIREASAKKIQSVYRGYWDRKKQNERVRNEFDAELQEAGKSARFSPASLIRLVQKVPLFYRTSSDGKRLVSVSQQLLKQKDEYLALVFQDPSQAVLHIKRILETNLRYLSSITDSATPIAVPMRMLEVFLSPTVYSVVPPTCGKTSDAIVCYLLKHLIRHGYFECVRSILKQKVPSSLERSSEPPTPVAASVLDLIMSPVTFATATSDKAFSRQVLLAVCRTLLCPGFTEQVSHFLLPAMAYGKYPFPFVELIQALITHTSTTSASSSESRRASPKSSSMSSASSSSHDNWIASPWLLFAILTIGEKRLGSLDSVTGGAYLELLQRMIPHLPLAPQADWDEDDSDEEEDNQMIMGEECSLQTLNEIRTKCIQLLDSPGHLRCVLTCLHDSSEGECIERVAGICYHLLSHQRVAVHKIRLLYFLAFNTDFIRNLWQACTTVSMTTVTGSSSPLLMMLSSGLPMAERDVERIIPLLSTFCALFSYSLLTLDDSDFYGDSQKTSSSMPFTLREMVPMSLALRNACLGIIELAHPDSKFSINDNYHKALYNTAGIKRKKTTKQDDERESRLWNFLFKVVSTLVKQIYSRDSRRPFCVVGHWLAPNVSVQVDKSQKLVRSPGSLPMSSLSRHMLDHPARRAFHRTAIDDDGPPLSNREMRSLIILADLPFVVSFEERVKILQRLIQAEKEEHQDEGYHFNMGNTINIMIRRPYIYEDAFEKLSLENEPNLKRVMRVHLVNAAGLDEAGIDGGGIFREFLSEVLKAGFDPNRGFFKYTAERQLYPNPQSSVLTTDFRTHFFFLGRMLGKVLLENMLVELPCATFFLAKILSHHSASLDIHHLQSMDPIIYKNLMFLKNYDGDVSDLGLDFTLVTDLFGETKVEELKPGGSHIAVTKENRIEYVHLMADYFLNKQIRHQCASFREGLADVIKLEWLQMFSSQELQVLISGASIPIDITDLQRYTNYSGGYTSDHSVIVMFWDVVSGFTDKQKRQLLKFVTSCSRPPLLGFKDLYPVFCIHNAGKEADRLPTASTCMNLLKLPEFTDHTTLRTKLLYAIESGAGFELS